MNIYLEAVKYFFLTSKIDMLINEENYYTLLAKINKEKKLPSILSS